LSITYQAEIATVTCHSQTVRKKEKGKLTAGVALFLLAPRFLPQVIFISFIAISSPIRFSAVPIAAVALMRQLLKLPGISVCAFSIAPF